MDILVIFVLSQGKWKCQRQLKQNMGCVCSLSRVTKHQSLECRTQCVTYLSLPGNGLVEEQVAGLGLINAIVRWRGATEGLEAVS